jgi:alkanesulfonate monooxygenase SsuD/methylene tetrahydromethanopterin reductase-like flavin-dependent oxidoreductase (luciferase family)
MSQQLTFAIAIGPQHWPWEQQIAWWKGADDLGFDALYLNDHFHSLGDTIDNPAFEALTALAAIATVTSRIRLGILTIGNTHRNPAILAKQLVTLDHLSGGRVIYGTGAGWNEPEHAAYSIPFPSAGDRVAMLEEALDLHKLLETEERTTFTGRFYRTVDTPFRPKPVNGRLPILIGGTKPKMLRVIGKHADIWDSSLPLDEYAAALKTIREHAREFGRDPESIVASRGVWNGKVDDKAFADTVRAAHKAGVRQFLFRPGHERQNLDEVPRLMESIVPELKTELDG